MINQKIIDDLKKYLGNNMPNLKGEFVKKNNGYDGMICDILTQFKVDTGRYWDAIWKNNEIPLEFKKGKSIWLDLVRYSEIKLESCDDAKKETITLFFIPDADRNKIEIIIGIKTSKIINKLAINNNDASFIIALKNKVPRSLNAQASLTVNDIKEIADFIVEN